MNIHELNNFTGTLGSGAYLAIDDGTDTGKISSQGLLAATEARIDNIIAGPAPSAEEIVDARLGADGVPYPSLGDAIRDQFTDVKSDLNELIVPEYKSLNLADNVIYNEVKTEYATLAKIQSSCVLKSGITYTLSFDTPSVSGGRAYVNGASGFDLAYFDLDGTRKSFSKKFAADKALSNTELVNLARTLDSNVSISNLQISINIDFPYHAYDLIGFSNDGYITPQHFGAVGDGVTDDTQAVQNAIIFAEIYTGWVHFPMGTYLCSGGLISRKGIKITGAGSGSKYTQSMSGGNAVSTIKLESESDADLLTLMGTAYIIRDLDFCGTYPTDEYENVSSEEPLTNLLVFSTTGYSWGNQECDSYIYNCRFRRATKSGLIINRVSCRVYDCMFDQCRYYGIHINSSECTVSGCEFYWCGFDDGANGCGILVSNWVVRIYDVNMYVNRQSIVIQGSARDIVIRDSALGSDEKNNVLCYGQGVLFDNVRFAGNGVTWFNCLYIANNVGSSPTEPIMLRDCLVDNAKGAYVIYVGDGNQRKIVIDNIRIKQMDTVNGFISTTENVKTLNYVDFEQI